MTVDRIEMTLKQLQGEITLLTLTLVICVVLARLSVGESNESKFDFDPFDSVCSMNRYESLRVTIH